MKISFIPDAETGPVTDEEAASCLLDDVGASSLVNDVMTASVVDEMTNGGIFDVGITGFPPEIEVDSFVTDNKAWFPLDDHIFVADIIIDGPTGFASENIIVVPNECGIVRE